MKELSDKAYEYLNKQQAEVDSLYGLSSYDSWYYDQYAGRLTFSDKGIVQVIIDYEEVGSLSYKTNTWLWAWANPNLEEKVKSKIDIVKSFGDRNQLKKLTDRKWIADEFDAWEMTAIAAYVMRAKGAYRVPSKDSMLLSFMIYKDIKWADSSKANLY